MHPFSVASKNKTRMLSVTVFDVTVNPDSADDGET
jgi:hypothetical protein